MAIKVKKNNNFVYLGGSNFISKAEKDRADKIYKYSKKMLEEAEKEIQHNENSLEALERWYAIGTKINKIFNNFDLQNKELKYFWLMLYSIFYEDIPKRAKNLHIYNDFRISFLLTDYSLNELKKVGPWSAWNEILGFKKISSDERVVKWVIKTIVSNENLQKREGRRNFLKKVRNRLKNINTEVLSDREVVEKLKKLAV